MKVYAIIACHNYGHFVADAIKSCLNQTYPTNICIINDGSKDNSAEVILQTLFSKNIEPYSQIINGNVYSIYHSNGNYFIDNDKCVGASDARNLCINLVKDIAEFLLIQDADDISKPNKVERLLKKFRFPGVGMVYADYEIWNTKDDTMVPEFKKPYNQMQLFYECMPHSQCLISMAAAKSVMEESNGFLRLYDPDLHGPAGEGNAAMEDWDCHIRLAEKHMIFHVPELLSVVRVHGNNASSPTKITSEVYQKGYSIIQQKAARREQIHSSNQEISR